MGAQDHLAKVLEAKHEDSGAIEGGACIQGDCAGQYKENDSCSYRWQVVDAYGKAVHPLGRTNFYVTPTLAKPAATARYETSKSKERKLGPGDPGREFYPPHYPAKLPIPDPAKKDWEVGGPTEDRDVVENGTVFYTVEQGKNYQRDTWPWWNNAHHLVPKATLRNAVEGLKNPSGWNGPATLAEVVKCFLLSEKYNVNHFRNMIILPMDTEVGEAIGLPRHLVLEDADAKAASGDAKTKMDHQAYGNLVEKELTKILDEFTKAAKQADKGTCVTEEMKAAKDRLDELSDRCYRGITEGVSKGQPISLLASIPASELA